MQINYLNKIKLLLPINPTFIALLVTFLLL